jgi:hypothetical protein
MLESWRGNVMKRASWNFSIKLALKWPGRSRPLQRKANVAQKM